MIIVFQINSKQEIPEDLESETMDSKPVTLQKLQWISIDHIY
jgi:hypothetical protein